MVPYERKNIMKFINFRFNWTGNNKVREDEKQFKKEHMPVEKKIWCNFKNPHRANSQACSINEFNFVFSLSKWAAPATTILTL
jgi:hypothetical protein